MKMTNPSNVARDDAERIENILFDSIVAQGVREGGTVIDFDTLIIDRQKAVDSLLALLREARIDELNYCKKYMISTSPFISEIIEPRLAALSAKEAEK